ncbi:MAG: lactonase family protein [Flavisolibacter sp.]
MKWMCSFVFFLLTASCPAQKKYMLAGTYTHGKSTGIYVYSFDTRTGDAHLVDSAQTSNPSYLAVSPDQHFVYAVNENAREGQGGTVTAYAFDQKTGHLSLLNQQASGGDDPCYLTLDHTGRWLLVGNYSSGTVSVLPVGRDGRLSKAVTTIRHQGKSINAERQESAHVHETVLSANNHLVYVPDLGMDKLMIYSFNPQNGRLLPAKEPFVKLTPGSGPRHFVIHPRGSWGYLIQEMGGTVTAFNLKKGSLKKFQTVSTVPENFKKPFSTAEIEISPDGRFLYASDRDSANMIAIFTIDPQNGRLSPIGYEPTQGRTPRHFNFDPTAGFLLVANQNSDNIVVFKRNPATGLLRDTGKRLAVGNPVCIQWIQ